LDNDTKNDSSANDDAQTLDVTVDKLNNMLETLSQNIQSAKSLFNSCVQLIHLKEKK
jgi:outer membrane murein-binding lipoprotein Lpp